MTAERGKLARYSYIVYGTEKFIQFRYTMFNSVEVRRVLCEWKLISLMLCWSIKSKLTFGSIISSNIRYRGKSRFFLCSISLTVSLIIDPVRFWVRDASVVSFVFSLALSILRCSIEYCLWCQSFRWSNNGWHELNSIRLKRRPYYPTEQQENTYSMCIRCFIKSKSTGHNEAAKKNWYKVRMTQ